MTVTKIGQRQVTQAMEAVKWTLTGDDAAAAQETRRRGRLAGPDAMAILHAVAMTATVSVAQRVRSAITLLDVGGFTQRTLESSFSEPEGVGEREAG
jgi:hypothetical protein